MYNYMSFWMICLLCLVFCLLFHSISFAVDRFADFHREKRRQALLDRDKKDAIEMVNALHTLLNRAKETRENVATTPAPKRGGPVS